MNFNQLLQPRIQKFIKENATAVLSVLALKKNPFPEIDYKEILNQIECLQKAKNKLFTWVNAENIIYPSKISVEQTSSEVTAKYKSEIISGQSIIDLTGGFGVDDYYFSKVFKNVTYCEINPILTEIVKHNFINLGVTNCRFITNDSYQTIINLNENFDWIYIDPSRRNDVKGKVFLLKDCLPNVPDLLPQYFKFSNSILIKTAPILDLKAGYNELEYVKKIHIVAVENEVKEILWEIEKNYKNSVAIITKNFTKATAEHFEFKFGSMLDCEFALPETYLYEPNSAIMKSGGFNEVAVQYGLKKLHQHSHLYTSTILKPFPGRIFFINKNISYCKKEMKLHFENKKSNVTTRNFSETVETIRSKWKIKEGGNEYSFFTTDKNFDKIVLICTKI